MNKYSEVRLITKQDNKEAVEIDTVYDLKNIIKNGEMKELESESYRSMDDAEKRFSDLPNENNLKHETY
jgi:hypothetical protein